jgi:hypothetical protein
VRHAGLLVRLRCGEDEEAVSGVGASAGQVCGEGEAGGAYLDLTINKAIQSCTKTYDPSYGERMKSEVREIVAGRRHALPWNEMRETKRRLTNYMLTIAATCGKIENGAVVFNANQEEAAEMIGITQPGVSKSLKEMLQEDGWLERTAKGDRGRIPFTA